MNRSHAIKLASQLPVGHPKRREILSRLRPHKVAQTKFDNLRKRLEHMDRPSNTEEKEEYAGHFFELMGAIETSKQAEILIEQAKSARSDFLRDAYQDFMRELTEILHDLRQSEYAERDAGPDPEEVATHLREWFADTWDLDVPFSRAHNFVKDIIK